MFRKDAGYYADLIARDELSVTEAVEMALREIERLNPEFNAVVHVQAKAARRRATEMDKFAATAPLSTRNTLPPFWGVPILLKDLGEPQKGQPTTSCSRLLAGNIAKESDDYIKAILSAGFVVVGRTNAPEFGTKLISDSALYGPVRAPIDYKVDRNPGGSSGGAAAAVKSGMIPIATASDAGGSIRVPASFNGLIGLKPSRGRMPIGPGNYRRWQGAAVNFALTKSVSDTEKLLLHLQSDSTGRPFTLPRISRRTIEPRRDTLCIAVCERPIIDVPIHPEATKALRWAKNTLKSFGHEVGTTSLKKIDFDALLRDYYLVNSAEMALSFQDIERQLGRKASLDNLEPMTWAWSKAGENVKATDFSLAIRHWDDAARILDDFFMDHDIIMIPMTNGPAPENGSLQPDAAMIDALIHIESLSPAEQQQLIYDAYYDLAALGPFGQLANICGLPAISLPVYETTEGLPVGVQCIARRGEEALLISLAKELEEAGILKTRIRKW